MKKNNFNLVSTKEKDDFLIREPEQIEDKIELTDDEQKAMKKKLLKRRVIRASILMFLISTLLVGFGLLWQNEVSLMAIGDALWLAFAIELGVGWIMFVYNHNIFSPLIHGVKTLGLMFVGKRTKDDYYTYYKNVEDEPIPNFYYIVVFTSALSLLIPALIILFILI